MTFLKLLDYFGRYIVSALFIMLLAIVIGNIVTRKDSETPDPVIVAMEPKPIEMLQAIPAKPAPQSAPISEQKTDSYRERLKRFDSFRSRVLLKEAESMEKQRLLAHLKTIHWIESQLSMAPQNGKEALSDRLMMIDFFDEALSWQENPARAEVLESIGRTLKVNNLRNRSKETRQMLAGDKIELFAILAQEAPGHAKELLEHTEDKQLQSIFQYAVKRLALKKLGESR